MVPQLTVGTPTAIFVARLQFPFAALILLTCGTSVFGEVYKDAGGFSFTYPDGWILVTAEKLKDVNIAIPEETSKWIEKNNVDLNRIDLLLIREPKGREGLLLNNLVVLRSA